MHIKSVKERIEEAHDNAMRIIISSDDSGNAPYGLIEMQYDFEEGKREISSLLQTAKILTESYHESRTQGSNDHRSIYPVLGLLQTPFMEENSKKGKEKIKKYQNAIDGLDDKDDQSLFDMYFAGIQMKADFGGDGSLEYHDQLSFFTSVWKGDYHFSLTVLEKEMQESPDGFTPYTIASGYTIVGNEMRRREIKNGRQINFFKESGNRIMKTLVDIDHSLTAAQVALSMFETVGDEDVLAFAAESLYRQFSKQVTKSCRNNTENIARLVLAQNLLEKTSEYKELGVRYSGILRILETSEKAKNKDFSLEKSEKWAQRYIDRSTSVDHI
jgi:hypothetical protein